MAGRQVHIILLRLVKPQGPAADIAVISREIIDRRFLQIRVAIKSAAIQQHLLENGQIISVAEETRMTRYAAEHRRSGIMYVAAQQLMPKSGLQRRRRDPRQREPLPRQEPGSGHAERIVEGFLY